MESAIQEQSLLNTQQVQKSNLMEEFKIYCICVLCALSGLTIFIVTIFGFDIIGLVLASTYSNATCYEHQLTMSLSTWLSVASGTSITFILFLFFAGFVLCVLGVPLLTMSAFFVGCAGVLTMYTIVISAFGIIELVCQFDPCQNEVFSICVMVILAITVKMMANMAFVVMVGYLHNKT